MRGRRRRRHHRRRRTILSRAPVSLSTLLVQSHRREEDIVVLLVAEEEEAWEPLSERFMFVLEGNRERSIDGDTAAGGLLPVSSLLLFLSVLSNLSH